MNSKRPTVERIRQPTLFDLQESSGTTDRPERTFSLPGIFLGTSSFTASRWERFLLSDRHAVEGFSPPLCQPVSSGRNRQYVLRNTRCFDRHKLE